MIPTRLFPPWLVFACPPPSLAPPQHILRRRFPFLLAQARASRRSQKSQMKQRLDQLEKLVHQVAEDNSRLQVEIETLRSPVKPATSQDA